MYFAKARVLSAAALFTGMGIVLVAVWLIWSHQSARYFPLLLVGLIIGCVSAPFYYYYKAKAKTSSAADEAVMGAYTAAAHQIAAEKPRNPQN